MEKDAIKATEKAISIKCGSKNPFINDNNEFIVNANINAYFDLKDVKTELDFKKKVVLELCYYCADNHWSSPWSKRILQWVNDVMGTSLTKKDMTDIYMFLSPLGGRMQERGDEYIRSQCDRSVLDRAMNEYAEKGGRN